MLPNIDAGKPDALRREGALQEARRLELEVEITHTLTRHRHWLSGRTRKVFDLFYNHGLSQLQIARKLDLHRHTVARHLKDARVIIARKLRMSLAQKASDG
jgi:DNA-directed RNA polymerase specialized sigma24 family protein